ncbi:hypothetical protein [Caulobacter vibrioides]|nr:hypothetical protein [Caulobacter vibrioides]
MKKIPYGSKFGVEMIFASFAPDRDWRHVPVREKLLTSALR